MQGENPGEPTWVAWLREQVDNATDMGQALPALRRAGVTEQSIDAALEVLRPKGSSLVDGRLAPPPLLGRAPPQLRKLDASHFDLYAYDDFLSAVECAHIIALADQHLQPSPLANATPDNEYRTSRTCLLAHLRSPEAMALDDKICRTIGIGAGFGEAIQVQRYDEGQQYKPHTDWFIPGSDAYARFARLRGNRTWTFMVYLNDGMEGGGTRFTEIDYTVYPKAGMALLWPNLHRDGTPNRLARHCGEPVIRGHKVIVTKWFRVLGDGPVFIQ